MLGELYINEKDAWSNWRVRLIENSYENLLLPPPVKEYASNNFRSLHGEQLLVSNPKYDKRDVQLMFAITCDSRAEYLEKYKSFITELASGWITLSVIDLNTVYKLVYSESIDLTTSGAIRSGKLSVKFNEPNPDDRLTNSLSPLGDRIFSNPFSTEFN